MILYSLLSLLQFPLQPVVVLTEYVTRRKRQAEFKLPVGLEESANDVSFARQCVVGGKYYETGTGPNKKDAKSAAAWNAFRALVREMYQEIGGCASSIIEPHGEKTCLQGF